MCDSLVVVMVCVSVWWMVKEQFIIKADPESRQWNTHKYKQTYATHT